MTETIKYTSTLIDKNLLAWNAEKKTIKLFAISVLTEKISTLPVKVKFYRMEKDRKQATENTKI